KNSHLRNDGDGSDSRSNWNRAYRAFHRDYQPEIRQCNFRLDLRFIAVLRVYNLAEFGECVVGSYGPKNEALTRWCILQVMETHSDLGWSAFMRLDENIRARTLESATEVYFHLGFIALLVSRDIEQWGRVSSFGLCHRDHYGRITARTGDHCSWSG